MSAVITVYPVPGRVIGIPAQKFKPVPPEGYQVSQHDLYFQRALSDGDLTLTPPNAPNAPTVATSVVAAAPAPAPVSAPEPAPAVTPTK